MRFRPPYFRASQSAFTMVEIAISLAVIGVALVAIIGVLPLGMNVQRDNREGTVINQDATVFMDAISKGARGLNDLTNYVYAITNYQTPYNNSGVPQTAVFLGYNYLGSSTVPSFPINSGTNIIGLLSAPQLIDDSGNPTNNLFSGGFSNHIIAYVRSMSGAAVEKPPQDNQIIQADAFGYRLLCVNTSVAMNIPSAWQASQSYNAGDQVFHSSIWWQATTSTLSGDEPGVSVPSHWTQNFYAKQFAASQREVRLTFLWPTLPNGSVGSGRQTYRATVAGQIIQTNDNGQPLYFFQSQSFTNAP